MILKNLLKEVGSNNNYYKIEFNGLIGELANWQIDTWFLAFRFAFLVY